MLMDGVSSLNDKELLTVLIESGGSGWSAEIVAEDLLAMTNHNLQTLDKLTPQVMLKYRELVKQE